MDNGFAEHPALLAVFFMAHDQSSTVNEEIVFFIMGCQSEVTVDVNPSFHVFLFRLLGIWNTFLCLPTPVQTTTLRRVPTTLTLRWLLRGPRLFYQKLRSSPSSSTQQTELTPGTRSVSVHTAAANSCTFYSNSHHIG